MANRRMFAKTIVGSDLFLSMPLSTQALYFQLGMQADDDGFVGNPRGIQRLLGCADDELKLLIGKGFLIPFESGVVVIRHWRVHNQIVKQRYTPTIYSEELSRLTLERNVYTLCDTQCYTPCITSRHTSCITSGTTSRSTPSVTSCDTQVRLGKVSIDIPSDEGISPPHKHKYGQYKNVLLSDEEMEKLKTEFPSDWDNRIERLSEYIASKGVKYKSHFATIRSWARKDKEGTPSQKKQFDYQQHDYTSDDYKNLDSNFKELYGDDA